MDLKHPTTKIPEPESDTPPRSQSIKLPSFTNGIAHHPPPPSTVVAYRECLKNHAASIGGHALDGCGEFMPSPTCTPTEPKTLKCAACGCHRNFHRRETTNDFPSTVTRNHSHFIDFNRPYQTSTSTSTSPSPPSPPPQPTNYAFGGHLMLSLSTAADRMTPPTAIKSSGRKRFRTKFSQEQKDKMMIFAERLGWKMQRCDDNKIADFCNEIGIKRGIFKVWMHNNKNTFGKREKDTTGAAVAVVRSDDSTGHENGSGTNGSSSSS
ncbi:hypothetical protein LXL04_025163 [Taraxacum kok-saghyz]